MKFRPGWVPSDRRRDNERRGFVPRASRRISRVRGFVPVIALIVAVLSILSSACAAHIVNPKAEDVVSTVPWRAPESHTYRLESDGDKKGDAVLSVETEGDHLVLKQRFSDDKGNVDESTANVDASTLKPLSSRRDVLDKDNNTRAVAEAEYQTPAKDCNANIVVQIKQTNFKPPNADKPDSERSSPRCVPEHAYDNNASLFLWRTIKFEKGYSVTYRTIIADRGIEQGVTLMVKDRTTIDTDAGKMDAWLVDIKADANTQQAWFAATDDHRLLRYNNGSLVFVLTQ